MKFTDFTALKKYVYFIVLSVLFVFVLSGCVLLPTEREPLAPPLVEPPRIRFNLHTVERRDIVHQVIGAGIFIPIREYSLSFLNNSGRLQAVQGVPGMQVEKGQVLAELESEQLEFDIMQMEIDLTKMDLGFEKLKLDYNRMIETKRDLKKTFDKDSSEQNKRALEDIEHQVAKFEIDLRIQELNIKQLEQHIQRLKDRLEASKIISPIDGLIVSADRLTIGEWIEPYRPLFTIADPSELFLRYSPVVVTGFEPGMSVIVDIEGTEHTGTIVMTPHGEPAIDVKNLRFEDSIIIKVEELPDLVVPGDNASIRVIFQEKRDVIAIPRAGLRTMGARNYVIIRKDEISREVDVEIGIKTHTLVEIVSGLEEGEQIILR